MTAGQPNVTPGVPWATARCGAPDCNWHREGIGRRGIEQVIRLGQKHADHRGHPVEIQRSQPATVNFE